MRFSLPGSPGSTNPLWPRSRLPAPTLAAWAAVAIGAVVLAGWVLGVDVMKSFLPGWPTMKANTALCVTLAGLALAFARARWSLAPAAVVMAIGAISIAEGLSGWDAGIDQLLFTDVRPAGHTGGPGRMAINTALAMVLLGAALPLARAESPHARRAAEIFAGLVVLIVVFYVIGVTLGTDILAGRRANFSAMALPTALALMALGAGVLGGVPDGWFRARVASAGPDGIVMRRLLPIAILVPIGVAWVRIQGEDAGLYDTRSGVALFTAATVAVMAAGGFWVVATLWRESRARGAAEHALTTSEERFRQAAEATGVGLWTWHLPTDEIEWTPVCAGLYGLEGLRIRSVELRAAIHPDDRPLARAALHLAWKQRSDLVVEYRAVWPDKTTRWLLVQGRPQFDGTGRVERMIGVAMDIDGRKRAQLALERSNSDLDRFAYVASHDLKEPLRMVSSYVTLLGERYRGRLDADADEFIAFAEDGALRMQRIIDDLLVYARTRDADARFGLVYMEPVLGAALAELRLAASEAGAAITHEALPDVLGDALQLQRLLANLLGNAIKFRRGSHPHIHVRGKRTNGECLFSVSDDGIGIESRDASRIFTMFNRVHSPSEFRGTGLGLAIAKVIVERHHGRIWVDSEPGRGSTFFFTLPAPTSRLASPPTEFSGPL